MATYRCHASLAVHHLRAAPKPDVHRGASREGSSWFVSGRWCFSVESSPALLSFRSHQGQRYLTTSRPRHFQAEPSPHVEASSLTGDSRSSQDEDNGKVPDDDNDVKLPEDEAHESNFYLDSGKLWPFLSPLEEALGDHTAGESWPFSPKLDGTELTDRLLPSLDRKARAPVDIAVIASSIAKLPQDSKEYRLALSQLEMPDIEASLHSFTPNVLTAIVAGIGELGGDADGLTNLRRRAMEELLKRKPLRARHALCLLSAVGSTSSDGKPLVPPSKTLEVCLQALSERPVSDHDLVPNDIIAALEAIARLQCTRPSTHSDLDKDIIVNLCSNLLTRLQGGVGLANLIVKSYESSLAIRAFASLLVLPDVLEQDSSIATWLKSLRAVKWPRRLPEGLSDAQVAAAACMLAKCGAWTQTRCSFLLAQATRRDNFAKKRDLDRLSGEAGTLWLHAIALAGLAFDSATDHIPVEEVLLGCAETLALSGDAAPESLARALYALQALGKADERGLKESLLARLESLDATRFSSPTWELLGDFRSLVANAGSEVPELFRTDPWLEALGEMPASNANEDKPAEDE